MAPRFDHSNRLTRPTSSPAKRKGIPLTPLARRMLQDLQLAGLAARTQEAYLRAVRKVAQWLHKSPQEATEDELRRYVLFIGKDQQWEGNSLQVAYSGIEFFSRRTCPQDCAKLRNLRVPRQLKLPTVLTIAEVDQRIGTIRKPGLRCFFWTVYSLGLRLQEALHLQVADIDAGRLLVHVRRGKGHKDRLIPLTDKTLRCSASTGPRTGTRSGCSPTKAAISGNVAIRRNIATSATAIGRISIANRPSSPTINSCLSRIVQSRSQAVPPRQTSSRTKRYGPAVVARTGVGGSSVAGTGTPEELNLRKKRGIVIWWGALAVTLVSIVRLVPLQTDSPRAAQDHSCGSDGHNQPSAERQESQIRRLKAAAKITPTVGD